MLSTLRVEKQDAADESPLAGADFDLVRDDGDGEYEEGVDEPVDSCTTGENGRCSIGELEVGTYFWVETGAPEGYELPEDTVSEPVVIDDDNAGTQIEPMVFADPQTPTDLSVNKTDADTGQPLAGAEFELYRNASGGVGDSPDEGDELIDSCTTNNSGTCEVTGLGFGNYYWYERSAPQGYQLPADRTSQQITIDAENAGDTMAAYEASDPQKRSRLQIQKQDQTDDSPLAGADFDLVRDDGDGEYEEGADEPVDSCTTGENGRCSIGQLPFGTYFWVETDAPDGYDLPANPVSEPIEVTSENAGSDFETTVMADPQTPTDLTVRKVDVVERGPLGGAGFELYRDDGDGVGDAPDEGDEVVGECTTGPEGTCTVGELGFGDYYWYEVTPPPDNQLPEDRTSPLITVDAQNAGTDVTPYVFTNPRLELSVEKQDRTDESPLGGAEFDLVRDDGDNTYEQGDDEVIGSCTTSEDDGRCEIGDLRFGTYFWVETAAPDGYRLPSDPVSGPINVREENESTTVFTDPQTQSRLSVTKTDADTGKPLRGAGFELYRDDGDGVEDAPDDGDERIGECATGRDGRCAIGSLDFGDYYWYESQVPDGYAMPDDRTSEVTTIGAGNAGSDFAAYEASNSQVTSQLSVIKRDRTNGDQLRGADFDLVRDDGDGTYERGADDVVDSCTTGGDGRCSISDLRFGTYFWVETDAPTGYSLPNDPVSRPVTISAEHAGATIRPTRFADPRTRTAIGVRKLAEDTGDALAGARFVLYRDDGDGAKSKPDKGDQRVDACTTRRDGKCTIGGLDFGDYYWYEKSAPRGYRLPNDRTSAIVAVDARNAGEAQTVEFVDPPRRNDDDDDGDDDTPPDDDNESPPPDDDNESPPPDDDDDGDLPDTGAPEVLGLLIAAGVLILTGVGLLLLTRRRTRQR